MHNFTVPIPLSLYIHIPWCIRKCPYCDFNSHAVKDELPEMAYIDALLADLIQDLPKIWGRKIQSIFIGGGTPSLLSPQAIEKLLTHIRSYLPILPQTEITLEANPSTVENERFQAFRQLGINRLSIGIQSFNDKALQQLGRVHNRQTALQAIDIAKTYFENFNLDLMFGLPQQTPQMALNDLELATSFQPPHLSWYQLTIEPNTYFHHKPPVVPDDDTIWDIQQQGKQFLIQKNYLHYEISAFAQPKHYCQHNINYWQFGDYLGIGAGAHSKITDVASNTITRFVKQAHPEHYLAKAATLDVIMQQQNLNVQDLCLEFMMNALRLTNGFALTQFEQHTGLNKSHIMPSLKQAIEQGWLQQDGEKMMTTDKGQQFLNDVLMLF